MMRGFAAALMLTIFAGAPAVSVSAQIRPETGADLRALETRLQDRFQILPIANGVVLTPKFRTAVRSVEVTDCTIAVDGIGVTGAELRDKLGSDADLIFQLSYLDPVSRRALLGLEASPAPAPGPGAGGGVGAGADAGTPRPPRPRRSGAIVRFAGNVTIASDEIVAGDVAVIAGSADIDGEVTGDVAVVGGSLRLGPHATVQGDVAVVGGSLTRDPGATIGGDVADVGIGDALRGRRDGFRPQFNWWRGYSVSPFIGLGGTVVRIALMMLLAGIVLLVARAPVEQIADRAAAEPLKSWAVGVLAELLFAPVLVVTVVVLAVSIIGIPLLLLVPVAIVAFVLVCLVGFTGVAYHVGRLVEGRFEQLRIRPYLATIICIVVIVSPLLVARAPGFMVVLAFLAFAFVLAWFTLAYVLFTSPLAPPALMLFY